MKDERLYSLDALRGFDMLFISGLAGLIYALCTLFPGGTDSWLAVNMEHVEWNGLAHHDTIFPLFLFIAGISFPFSFAKQRASGVSRGYIYFKIVRRGIALVILGMLYNGLLRNFGHIRIFSVLGRIGLAWMFAALMYVSFSKKINAVLSAVILLGYWYLCTIPAPDAPVGADPMSYEACLVGWVDRTLFPGFLLEPHFDPEGLLSVLPAIVTAMLGMFTGDFVCGKNMTGDKKTLWMLAGAVVMLAAGLLWSRWFPVNKKLWTSTFVLVVGAYSLAIFALFYWIIDVRGFRKWAFPLKVVGMNSIAIYMLPAVVAMGSTINFLFGGVMNLCPAWNAVIFNAAFLGLTWLFTYFLYRQNIFLKV